MSIQCEKIDQYRALGRALRLTDGRTELIVTLDVGPRIIHVSLPGMPSVLEDDCPLQEQLPDGRTWRIYGGHRVWHSPEAYPRSYMQDNEPLERYELFEDGILLVEREEPWTQIQKSIEVRFTDQGVRVTNHLANHTAWPVEYAVWALSVGSRGGREVCPVVQRNAGLQTNTGYRQWSYSRMDDPRVHWGRRYIVVDNDPADESAFKFGYENELGWIAYFNHDQCFVKKFPFQRGAGYPDRGCNYETYTCYWGVELESLSPLKLVKPGEIYSHTEEWCVLPCVGLPTWDEDEIAAKMAPLAEAAGIELPEPSGEGWDPTFQEE